MKRDCKRPFMGLVMGRSRPYYANIIRTIGKEYNTDAFSWRDVMEKYPDITKSVLTRLKESDWIIISDTNNYRTRDAHKWMLHPNAIDILNYGDYDKNV